MTRPTDDERKAALVWFTDGIGKRPGTFEDQKYFAVVKQMLDEPRLPADPPPELLARIAAAIRNTGTYDGAAQAAWETYREIRKYVTQPKTVKVWRVRSRLQESDISTALDFRIETELHNYVMSMLATGWQLSIETVEVPT